MRVTEKLLREMVAELGGGYKLGMAYGGYALYTLSKHGGGTIAESSGYLKARELYYYIRGVQHGRRER